MHMEALDKIAVSLDGNCSDIGPCYWTKGLRNRNIYRQSTKQPGPLSYSLGRSPLFLPTLLLSAWYTSHEYSITITTTLPPFPQKKVESVKGEREKRDN